MSALALSPTAKSERLFFPVAGRLHSESGVEGPYFSERKLAEQELEKLISQKNYPCIAALQSFHRDDYMVGIYEKFGVGNSWWDLRNDLNFFLRDQLRSGSVYSTFWAIFSEQKDVSEEVFEQQMWQELSFLTSKEDKNLDWRPGTTQNPEDKDFCFQLFGEPFFVVGLHPSSSRKGRKFHRPALVFNVFRQFEKLMNDGHYDGMVKINRQRDERFQGEANPMVLEHGDNWETIQFSGKKNPGSWKCPFRFLSSSMKPHP